MSTNTKKLLPKITALVFVLVCLVGPLTSSAAETFINRVSDFVPANTSTQTAEADGIFVNLANQNRANNQNQAVIYGPEMQEAARLNPAVAGQISSTKDVAQTKLDQANRDFQAFSDKYTEYKTAVTNGDLTKAGTTFAEMKTLENNFNCSNNNCPGSYRKTIQPTLNAIQTDEKTREVYEKKQAEAGVTCGVPGFGGNLSKCIQDLIEKTAAFIGEVSLTVTGLAVYLGGTVLDLAVKFSIEDFRTIVSKTAGIKAAWVVIRNFANMFFIFLLLYAAIKTVLGSDMKKTIASVIIAALVINFSFFITSIFIDISNTLTIGIMNQTIGTSKDISLAVMQSLKLQDAYSSAGLQNLVGKPDAFMRIATIGVMGSVFFLVTAFVFFAAAIMFLLRAATFFVLLILSPFAFFAMALPQDNFSKKWWEPLISNVLFAPMFMVMIYISLEVAKGLTNINATIGGSGATLADAFTKQTNGSPVFNFIIIIMLMVMSLIVAKNMGAAGASGAISLGNKLRGGAQGYLGRGTLRLAQVNRLDSALKNSRFGNTAIGSALRNITTGTLVKQKFGSGESISDANKKVEKRREKFTEISVKTEQEKAKKEYERQKAAAASSHTQGANAVTEAEKAVQNAYAADAGVRSAVTKEQQSKIDLAGHDALIKQKEQEVANAGFMDKVQKEQELAQLKSDRALKQQTAAADVEARKKEEERVAAPYAQARVEARKARMDAAKKVRELEAKGEQGYVNDKLEEKAKELEEKTARKGKNQVNPYTWYRKADRTAAAKALRDAAKGKSNKKGVKGYDPADLAGAMTDEQKAYLRDNPDKLT